MIGKNTHTLTYPSHSLDQSISLDVVLFSMLSVIVSLNLKEKKMMEHRRSLVERSTAAMVGSYIAIMSPHK